MVMFSSPKKILYSRRLCRAGQVLSCLFKPQMDAARKLWRVGEKARVKMSPTKTCRCLILRVGGSADQPVYGVLLVDPETDPAGQAAKSSGSNSSPAQSGVSSDRDMSGVPEENLTPLQEFEKDDSLGSASLRLAGDLEPRELEAEAESLKEKGNILFKLGDTEAATEIFMRVLKGLEPALGVGAAVFVKPRDIASDTAYRYRPAMVSDTNAEDDAMSYGVIYDDEGDEGDDEEDAVTADRIAAVPKAAACVACAARLNLARCRFRESRHREVIDACTLVIAICKLLVSEKQRPRQERVKLRSHSVTALRMRGNSHLAQNHVTLARKDARSMARSAADEEERGQAARFEVEVDKKSKSLLKANRKLAKDISQWVNASMAKHEEASADRGGAGSHSPSDSGVALAHSGQESESEDGGFEECKGQDSERTSGNPGRGISSWIGDWLR